MEPGFKLAISNDASDAFPYSTLRHAEQYDGIRLDQVAVDFSPDSNSETGLGSGYDVPSYDCAAAPRGHTETIVIDGRKHSGKLGVCARVAARFASQRC
ncbi:hypothetical protein ACQEV9_05270 [Streptomyces chartreusis]|uniref:hypothetical protein n=1 Tax=Streptomyces chartreusis TaxID=1969 RepID=UPI003D90FF80